MHRLDMEKNLPDNRRHLKGIFYNLRVSSTLLRRFLRCLGCDTVTQSGQKGGKKREKKMVDSVGGKNSECKSHAVSVG